MSGETFHSGERAMQEQHDSRRLADAIHRATMHAEFTDNDRAFIARMPMFFLATSDAAGNLDCSYKGGDPGFVRVTGTSTLAFPNYDGNGMFMSLGNISEHARVGLLFIDFERQSRMRVNGTARVSFDDPLLEEYPEATAIVHVTAEQIFPNCPRYIHKMELVERSVFVPQAGCETPEAGWKAHFADALPETQRRKRAGDA